MSVGRRGLAIAIAVGVSTTAAVARADAPLDLTWVAPTGCPTADDVRKEFARLVHVPADRPPPAFSADARIEPRGGRYALRLHTVRDGQTGEREIEAESCASLAHAAALVLVLAYGEGQDAPPPPPPPPPRPRALPPRPPVVEAPPPPPPPPVEAPPPPAAPVVVVVAPPPPPPVVAPAIWSLAAEGGAGGSPIPGVGARVGVGVDVERRRFLATLRLEGWLPTDGATAAAGVAVRYSGAGVSVGACWAPVRAARVAVLGCGFAGAAGLRGASTGATTDRSALAPWLTLAPAVRARVRLGGPVSVDARVEAKVSLAPPRFAIENLGDVQVVPRVVPAGILGLSLDI
jgi:hypothetical protein